MPVGYSIHSAQIEPEISCSLCGKLRDTTWYIARFTPAEIGPICGVCHTLIKKDLTEDYLIASAEHYDAYGVP